MKNCVIPPLSAGGKPEQSSVCAAEETQSSELEVEPGNKET
jgi:hypothetical protein